MPSAARSAQGVLDWQIADQRDKEEERWKKRHEEIEGELCGQPETVVVSDLFDRSFYDLRPRDGYAEVGKHHDQGLMRLGTIRERRRVSTSSEARIIYAATAR